MTQVVQLSDEAYRRLTNAKRPGESYSDVVLRLAGSGDLTDLEGLRDPEAIREAEALVEAADRRDEPGDRL